MSERPAALPHMSAPNSPTRAASPREVAQDVLARYSWGFCRRDFDLLATVFAPDVVVEFPNGRQTGRDAVMRELQRRRTGWAGMWIYSNNVMVDAVSDVELRVRSCTAIVRARAEDDHSFSVVGWYDDVMRLVDGHWCVHHRDVHLGN